MLLSSPDLVTLRATLLAQNKKSFEPGGCVWKTVGGVSVPPSFCDLSRDLIFSLEVVLWGWLLLAP